MKVMVLTKFYGRIEKKWFEAGEIVECTKERGEQFIEHGFAELVEIVEKPQPKGAKKE